MKQIDRIDAIAALLGSLFLATSSSRFRIMSGANWVRLAALLARVGGRRAGA